MRNCCGFLLGVSLLFSMASLHAQQQAETASGTIEGIVVDADTNLPIEGAMVLGRTRTGSDGRFILSDVPAGRTRVRVSRAGYTEASLLFTVEPGQRIKDAMLRLRANGVGGVVAGRVVDTAGRPVVLANVGLFQQGYPGGLLMYGNPAIKPGLQLVCCAFPHVAPVRTNDLGEFRMSAIAPGRYLVAFRGGPQGGAVFFPGTQDLSKAVLVEVKEGQETRVGTVTLTVPLGTIRVRLTDAANNAVSSMGLSVVYRYEGVSEDTPILSAKAIPDQEGIAELPVSFPGFYVIDAALTFQGSRLSGQALVEFIGGVASASIKLREDLSGYATYGFSQGLMLKGRMSVETATSSASAPGPELRNTLFLTDNPPSTVLTRMLNTIDVQPDGTFQVEDLHSGDYSPLGFPAHGVNYYIVSARQGQRNALEDGAYASASGDSPVEIVLSTLGGQLKGTVVDSEGKPVHDAVVGLVPGPEVARRRDRKQTYRTDRTDQNGVFELKDLVPGSYRIYGWDLADLPPPARPPEADNVYSIIEDGAILDPEFMKRFEAVGKAVDIRKNERTSVEVRIIKND